MARNKGPRKAEQFGVAGPSFLDDHAFRMPPVPSLLQPHTTVFVVGPPLSRLTQTHRGMST
jgi:hypothetical protein